MRLDGKNVEIDFGQSEANLAELSEEEPEPLKMVTPPHSVPISRQNTEPEQEPSFTQKSPTLLKKNKKTSCCSV